MEAKNKDDTKSNIQYWLNYGKLYKANTGKINLGVGSGYLLVVRLWGTFIFSSYFSLFPMSSIY